MKKRILTTIAKSNILQRPDHYTVIRPLNEYIRISEE
jgi:hypothetical protein